MGAPAWPSPGRSRSAGRTGIQSKSEYLVDPQSKVSVNLSHAGTVTEELIDVLVKALTCDDLVDCQINDLDHRVEPVVLILGVVLLAHFRAPGPVRVRRPYQDPQACTFQANAPDKRAKGLLL